MEIKKQSKKIIVIILNVKKIYILIKNTLKQKKRIEKIKIN